jgi:hypothetical protein
MTHSLAARLIARLSPQRRANLECRIRERLERLTLPEPDGDGYDVRREDMPTACRLTRMLGRLAALTA